MPYLFMVFVRCHCLCGQPWRRSRSARARVKRGERHCPPATGQSMDSSLVFWPYLICSCPCCRGQSKQTDRACQNFGRVLVLTCRLDPNSGPVLSAVYNRLVVTPGPGYHCRKESWPPPWPQLWLKAGPGPGATGPQAGLGPPATQPN